MFYKKTLYTLALILFLGISGGLWAGDTATFVDLGFSPDGRTYMFAQYGVQSRTLRPWADLFVVDVALNNFVTGGRISYVHNTSVVSGNDGSGALYHLIARNAALAERHGVNFFQQGQPLYLALDNTPSARQIEFRDFESGTSYQASLVSNIEGSCANLRSSFFINLERTARDGTRRSYTVGTPQIRRPLIASYHIWKVLISPRDGSMIFVIEMNRQEGGENLVRYMIEAVRL